MVIKYMIERYNPAEQKKIWSEEEKFKRWLLVELSVLKVLEKNKIVPKNTEKKIRLKAKKKTDRILELEKILKHDVLSFTTSIAEQVGEPARFFHFGLTSSDVVDTAFSLALVESAQLILKELEKLLIELKKLSIKYKYLPTIGRTHGVHAEPTSFGLKNIDFYKEIKRHQTRFRTVIEEIRYGKLSGAVGVYGILPPKIEKEALKNLNLKVETVSTQILPRDRHARFFSAIAEIGNSIERIALEIRHLQRTEVRELEESFGVGQKGSSAMPHKKNPIASENLTGCARILRGYALSAFENVALWHERDISHSSVERIIAPDATALLHYMIERMTGVLKDLKVNSKKIEANLELTHGMSASGKILLALIEKGLSREDAYSIVQGAALTAWEKNSSFLDELKQRQEYLSKKDLGKWTVTRTSLKYVNEIYKRAFSNKT